MFDAVIVGLVETILASVLGAAIYTLVKYWNDPWMKRSLRDDMRDWLKAHDDDDYDSSV